MNGARVTKHRGGSTLFISLPRELWRPIEGAPCRCPVCTKRGVKVSYWDTLAVHPSVGHAWTVHKPGLYPADPRDSEEEDQACEA